MHGKWRRPPDSFRPGGQRRLPRRQEARSTSSIHHHASMPESGSRNRPVLVELEIAFLVVPSSLLPGLLEVTHKGAEVPASASKELCLQLVFQLQVLPSQEFELAI